MSRTLHAAKLIAYKSTTLDSLTYAAGEVVYDADNNTLRLMNSTTFGGTKIATQPWTTSTFTTSAQVTSSVNTALTAYTTTSGLTTLLAAKASTSSLSTVATSGSYTDLSSKPTINTLAPTQTGNSGKFLTTDSNVVSWSTVSYTNLTDKPTIPTNNNQLTNGAGYITTTGIPTQTNNSGKYLTTDGTTLSWGTVATLPTQTNNVGRILTTDGTSASWITPASSRLKLLTGSTGTVSHTFSDGPIWRHSSISANFVANFTGIPATEGTVLTITLQLVQGVTPYMPTAVQVEGVSAGSILWFGGVSSGNASKTNVVIFTLVRSASTWAVLGEVKSYG